MASGGTEVGSIKGLLELDITDYMAGIEKAKAAEQELKHDDGDDLHIGADIHEAVEKMDEVGAKADRLGDESRSLRMDADVQEAVSKLDAVATTVDEATSGENEVHVDADVQEAMGKVEQVAAAADDLEARRIRMRVDANVDEAIARIDEVAAKTDGVERPHTVIVDANTGEAVGEVEAVRAAEASLERQNARLAAAYAELDEVQSQTVFSQSSLMTAEAAATRVEQEQAEAQERLNRALAEHNVTLAADTAASTMNSETTGRQASQTGKAADAKRADAAAMRTDTAATETDTVAKDANAAAADNQTSSYHELRSALLLVAPALVPIAGAAAGAGTAMIGMAASGMLAFRGVKQAMESGSMTGAQYRHDIDALKSDLDGLSNAGAVAYLNGMDRVTSEMHAAMPALNGDVSMFSRGLGAISGNALAGVLGLLRQMTPVLTMVDRGLESASAKFASWGTGSGAKQFVSYLMSTLPSVGSALGSLAGAVGHVAGAFAPWGSLVLSTVTGVSDVIRMIPTPVLSVLATGAMSAYTAFKLFGAVTSIIQGVQAAMAGLAAGSSLASLVTPLGAVTLAVGLLGAAYAAVAGKNRQATDAQQDYTSALQQSNGVIDANVAKSVAKRAKDSGALDAANELGIAQGKVTDAITGQNDAYDALTKQLQKTIDQGTTYTTTQYGTTVAQDKNAQSAQKLLKAVQDQHGAYQKASDDQKQVAAAAEDTTTKLSTQAQVLGLSEAEWTRLQGSETAASDAAKDYKSALDALNGQAQTLDQATSTLTMQFDTMDSSIKQNITQVEAAQATSMDVNTTYGAKNHQLIEQTVKDAQDKADAIINSEGGTKQAYDDARQSLEQSRQKILEVAQANGLNRDQVSQLLDEIMKPLPDPKTHITVDDKQAQNALQNLNIKTANVSKDHKTVTIKGNNKDAMTAISLVTGAKINSKTGKIMLNKSQYDVALALANGAKINPKTGMLDGNGNPLLAKVAKANGWTINKKTGVISGDNGPFRAAKKAVESATIRDKKIHVGAETSGFWNSINGILSRTFHVNVSANGGRAAGGLITGPGTGTSDEIPTNLSNGEFVMQAAAVQKYGVDFLQMLNWRRFANGGSVGSEFSGAVTGPASPIKDNVILRNARLNPGEHVLTVDDVRAMGGQKAVYAFRSSLHNPQVYRTKADVDAPRTASTTVFPSTVTLVDSDGTFLGRMRVIARETVGRERTNLVRGLING